MTIKEQKSWRNILPNQKEGLYYIRHQRAYAKEQTQMFMQANHRNVWVQDKQNSKHIEDFTIIEYSDILEVYTKELNPEFWF